MKDDSTRPTFVEIAFGVTGTTVPRHYRTLLATALEKALPRFADDRRCGVHRLNLAHGMGGQDLISPRTRLILRVPRMNAQGWLALGGCTLDLAGFPLFIGAGRVRELLPHATLYAHFVATEAADEGAFLAACESELLRIGVRSRAICGRWQVLEAQTLASCSLMLDGLTPEDSLRILERGLGRHRRLGCGLFVPHKSPAAVGTLA